MGNPEANQDGILTFLADGNEATNPKSADSHWKILIVDDEADVHKVTRIVLGNFKYKSAGLAFQSAYSAKEALEILREQNDFAIILLDVIMESSDAGLKLARAIREELGMRFARIILRTGQPGKVPESTVIRDYDIDDYESKAELTNSRLHTIVTTALRNYELLRALEELQLSLEDKVEQRTKELAESNRAKDRLYEIIAHDLRGPIGTVASLIEVLILEGPQNEAELADILKRLHQSLRSSQALLENLLFWARDQQGQLFVDLRNQALSPIVEDVRDLLSGQAESKEVSLSIGCPADVTARVDRNMFSLIVRNLVSNAIKFTPRGGAVSATVKDRGDSIELEVNDSGVGIPETRLRSLFDFSQHYTTFGTDNEKGSGLGLSLCEKFAKRQGGTILAFSSEGRGSKFLVTLPK